MLLLIIVTTIVFLTLLQLLSINNRYIDDDNKIENRFGIFQKNEYDFEIENSALFENLCHIHF